MLNYHETHTSTLEVIERGTITFYLDQHAAAGSTPEEEKLFWTIAQDEYEMYYYDNLAAAQEKFNSLRGAPC